MHVLMLSFDFLPNIGGVAAHIYYLSNALMRHGTEVTVLQPTPSTRYAMNRTHEHGLDVVRVHYKATRSRPLNVLRRRQATIRAVSLLSEELGPFDVVHQHDLHSVLAARWTAQTCTWVWTNHMSQFIRDSKSRVRSAITRWLYRPAEAIICASHERAELSRLVWDGKPPVEFIPNGVDCRTFAPGPSTVRAELAWTPDDVVVLCPSRFARVKGVAYLAEAAVELLSSSAGLRLKFLLAGDAVDSGPELEYAARIREQLALYERSGDIRFMGNVPLSVMPSLYRAADIVVIPSLQDAISLTVLEAMATGVPVIATNVGGLPEVVDHNNTGLIVEPGSPNALASAIRSLAGDSVRRTGMSRLAIEKVSREYSWDHVALRTLEVYESSRARWKRSRSPRRN